MAGRRLRAPLGALAAGAMAFAAHPAEAQQPPPSGPPPYYAPPAYAPPPGPPQPSAYPGSPSQPSAYPVSPRDYGAGPETLDFREGMFVPPGYHLGHRPHRAVLITGAGLIASAYFIGVTVGAFDGYENEKGWLFVPVAGPWITLSQRRTCPTVAVVCQANDSGTDVLLVMSGVAQAAGVLTMLVAVGIKEKVLVRNDAHLLVLPSAVALDGGRTGAGFMALGRF